MATSKDPRRLYLKLRGAQWFLNFPIPADLRSQYLTAAGKPRDHIVMTTGTSDLTEAARIKFTLIQRLQTEFRQKRRELSGAQPEDLLRAKGLAKDMEAASNSENYEVAADIQMVISSQADQIREKGGNTKESLERARAFVNIATGGQPLMDAFADWMDNSSLPERTRAKYKTAVEEFATFLGGLPVASQVTKANAMRYVDWLNKEARSQRTNKVVPLSYNTKRDRVMALSAFWNLWFSPRGKAVEPANPWSRLNITEKPTPSTVKWDSLENTGRPQRRDAFEESELVAILDAPGPSEKKGTRYTKKLLMEIFALTLLTGARPDELCSLTLGDVKLKQDVYWLNFDETKTKDDRQIPVVHPTAVALLKGRIGKRKDPSEQLFPELKVKGKGDNLYELVGRALGRHLDRAEGLEAGDVPYMTRHTFATIVGNTAGVQDHALKRYIGHKPEGMTDRHYRNVPPEALLAVAKKVKMPRKVEAKLVAELGV